MAGPDTDEFRAVVAEQLDANQRSIDRLSEENRLLRDAVSRLLGQGLRDDPADELAAARRRKRERGGRRHAGFIAVPIAVGALVGRALLRARHAAPLARVALGAGAAVGAAVIVSGAAYVVTHAPAHYGRPDSSIVTSPPPRTPHHRSPGRSPTPIPRRGLGKGTAARRSRRTATPPQAAPSSRAAVPSTMTPATVPGATAGVSSLPRQLPSPVTKVTRIIPSPSLPAPVASITSLLPTPGVSVPWAGGGA